MKSKNKYITFEEILSNKSLNIFWIIIDNPKNILKFNKTNKKGKINLEIQINEINELIQDKGVLHFMTDEIELHLNSKLENEEKSKLIWNIINILNKEKDDL